MKKTILLLLVAFIYLSCQKLEVIANGTVEGTFTISPLCGIQPANATQANPCGFSDARLDEIYGQYKIVLTDGNSKSVAEKKFDHTGLFSLDLPAGNYTLDIQPKPGISTTVDRSGQSLPMNIVVVSGQKNSLVINANTGIR
jgi:hypothetical protein